MEGERKVIQLGNSALCITMPQTWLTKNHIQKGDTLQVQETLHNALEILPEKKTSNQQEISLDASNKTADEILQLLVSTYLNGFTHITLNNCNQKITTFIKEQSKQFIAAELMQEPNGTTIINVFWDEKNINLDSTLLRIGQITKNLFELLDALVEKNESFVGIQQQSTELQRQILFSQRAVLYAMWNSPFAKKLHRSSLQLTHTSYTLYFYGTIGDYIIKIARLIHQTHNNQNHLLQEETTNQHLRTLLKQASTYYAKVFKASHDKTKVNQFIFTEFAKFSDEIDAFRNEHHEEQWVVLFAEFMKVLNFKIKEAESTIINNQYTPSN